MNAPIPTANLAPSPASGNSTPTTKPSSPTHEITETGTTEGMDLSFDSALGAMLVTTMLPQDTKGELLQSVPQPLTDALVENQTVIDEDVEVPEADVPSQWMPAAVERIQAKPLFALNRNANVESHVPQLTGAKILNDYRTMAAPQLVENDLAPLPEDVPTRQLLNFTSGATGGQQGDHLLSPQNVVMQPATDVTIPLVEARSDSPTEVVSPGDLDVDADVQLDSRIDSSSNNQTAQDEFLQPNQQDNHDQPPAGEPAPVRQFSQGSETSTALGVENLNASQTEQVGSQLNRVNVGDHSVNERLVDQITEQIRVEQKTVNNKTETTIEIELDPPELGRARVELREADNGISAKIVMSREASARVIENSLDALRESLRDSGVEVTDFDISYEDPSSQKQDDYEEDVDRLSTLNFNSEPVRQSGSQTEINHSVSNRRIDLTV